MTKLQVSFLVNKSKFKRGLYKHATSLHSRPTSTSKFQIFHMFVKVVELQNQLLINPLQFVPLRLINPSPPTFPMFSIRAQNSHKTRSFQKPKMKLVSPFSSLALAFLLLCLLPVNGQMNVPCNASMLSSFSPCMNFVTNSSGNGTSPTADCCNAIQSLASGGRDCLCLIVTGRVPFQIPINRTLAISLPRACNLPGVPLQCNAATAPVPAPGPISLGPSLPPESSPSASPQGPEPTTPAAETPSSPLDPEAQAPTATAGSRPVLTPSSAVRSNSFPPPFLLLGFAFVIFKFI